MMRGEHLDDGARGVATEGPGNEQAGRPERPAGGWVVPPLVLAYGGRTPWIAEDVFLAPGAVIVGDVEIGPGASVWFHAVIRGDLAPVRIGARSNVQDGAVIHVDHSSPCYIGEDVTIGHRAIVHGCVVGDGATIGMGATVLSRARVGARATISAGAVVVGGAEIRPGALALGVPARERQIQDPSRQAASVATANRYVGYAARYRLALGRHAAREEDRPDWDPVDDRDDGGEPTDGG